jgi:hypothetical protein
MRKEDSNPIITRFSEQEHQQRENVRSISISSSSISSSISILLCSYSDIADSLITNHLTLTNSVSHPGLLNQKV